MAKTLFDLGLIELIIQPQARTITGEMIEHPEIQFCGKVVCGNKCPVNEYCRADSVHSNYGSLTKDELEEFLNLYPEARIIL